MLRLFVGDDAAPLAEGGVSALPAAAVRHVQARRLQPGDAVVLFDGTGRDVDATVDALGRGTVRVRVGTSRAVDRELPLVVTLALAMPANERMDSLVEKATELGVARIQPLMTERSVLRLDGERAARRGAHWRAVAIAACEQSGRARLPAIEPVQTLAAWLADAVPAGRRLLLSLDADARPWAQAAPTGADSAGAAAHAVVTLSGPEGGLTRDEAAAARGAGFVPVSLGRRVLRADTAPLAALAWLALTAAR